MRLGNGTKVSPKCPKCSTFTESIEVIEVEKGIIYEKFRCQICGFTLPVTYKGWEP